MLTIIESKFRPKVRRGLKHTLEKVAFVEIAVYFFARLAALAFVYQVYEKFRE